MKKIISILFIICLLSSISFIVISENTNELPYESYVYNNDGKALLIPAPFVTKNILTGFDLKVGKFDGMTDIFYDGTGYFYICDTGNNRVIVVDTSFKVISSITAFDNNGNKDTFNEPTGVFANDKLIYVADSLNGRIVSFFRKDFSYNREFKKPVIDQLKDSDGNYNYLPLKVVADAAGRLYVLAKGVNQGIIRLDTEGKFLSFAGAPSVVPDLMHIIWSQFATKEQKARLEKFEPTEYDSLVIDKKGFIYATSKTSKKAPVVRLNSAGENILAKVETYGDYGYTTSFGQKLEPYFVDVTFDENGSYYLLDSAQGKIYTYSEEGKLLYVFASNAFQKGTFYSASSIEYFNKSLYVTDSSKGTITVFGLTEFGSNINSALDLYKHGLYNETKQMWQAVYNKSSNYILAITGIAQIDIQNGNYKLAMDKLKELHDYEAYALAFTRWRSDWIRDNFPWVLLLIVFAVLLFIIWKKFAVKIGFIMKIRQSGLYKKYKYSNYVIVHPFDGFWDIKHEKRGNAKAATLILIGFAFLYMLRAQFSGYVVTRTISSEVNPILDVMMILLPFSFWIISNWCFSTLMDGKGNLLDIYIASCYALKPYILFSIPLFVMSHIFTSEEATFYQTADKFVIIWMLALIFIGMMITHDYMPAKAFLTLVLTLVGICLIIFIILLFLSILQNVSSFFIGAYKEIILRIYG